MKTSDIIDEELWAGWIAPASGMDEDLPEDIKDTLAESEADDSVEECCF